MCSWMFCKPTRNRLLNGDCVAIATSGFFNSKIDNLLSEFCEKSHLEIPCISIQNPESFQKNGTAGELPVEGPVSAITDTGTSSNSSATTPNLLLRLTSSQLLLSYLFQSWYIPPVSLQILREMKISTRCFRVIQPLCFVGFKNCYFEFLSLLLWELDIVVPLSGNWSVVFSASTTIFLRSSLSWLLWHPYSNPNSTKRSRITLDTTGQAS